MQIKKILESLTNHIYLPAIWYHDCDVAYRKMSGHAIRKQEEAEKHVGYDVEERIEFKEEH